jgi:hypothetical protein
MGRNQSFFVAKAVQEWITAVGPKTAYITPGSPGRMDMSRVLMPTCAMNCSMAFLRKKWISVLQEEIAKLI